MPARSQSATLPLHRFHMLLALADGDRHGVGIMEAVLHQTAGRIRLWPAMLYRNLQQMVSEGLIQEVEGAGGPQAGSPRFFRITPAGRRACASEARRLEAAVELARARRLLGKGSRG
jgi:DNA-binding PadR family transcriptional regulator